jgi:hypothetical protein
MAPLATQARSKEGSARYAYVIGSVSHLYSDFFINSVRRSGVTFNCPIFLDFSASP